MKFLIYFWLQSEWMDENFFSENRKKLFYVESMAECKTLFSKNRFFYSRDWYENEYLYNFMIKLSVWIIKVKFTMSIFINQDIFSSICNIEKH